MQICLDGVKRLPQLEVNNAVGEKKNHNHHPATLRAVSLLTSTNLPEHIAYPCGCFNYITRRTPCPEEMVSHHMAAVGLQPCDTKSTNQRSQERHQNGWTICGERMERPNATNVCIPSSGTSDSKGDTPADLQDIAVRRAKLSSNRSPPPARANTTAVWAHLLAFALLELKA